MRKIIFKYRIDELMSQLLVDEYRIAMKVIPKLLNVSSKTFFNYRNIKLNENKDIPHEKVLMLEKLFDLQPGELQNFHVHTPSLTQIVETHLNKAK